jgi:copper resistance protein D
VWLGGLLPLAILLNASKRHGETPALTIAGEATRRFSGAGIVCVGVLIATGTVNSWLLVGSIPALVGTPYGRLLLIKLTLLFPLLALAAMNRLKLKPRLAAASLQNRSGMAFELVAKLKRNVIAETSLGMVVLLIVGSMGVTPPARHAQPQWPFSFRMSWDLIANAPKARAEVERGTVWAAIGLIALIAAIFRRRRRVLLVSIGIGTLAYAVFVILTPVTIDAYPMTYRRPAVAYQAISVANGLSLYRDSCVVCHGIEGQGDGPAAEDLRPKPADLTARHAANHTAGDLYWWLSYGVEQTAMPGFSESLSEEERWDLINFLRALSSAERARSLAPVIENQPWLVAPDFVYGTNRGEAKALKDHRDSKMVLLVVFSLPNSLDRLIQLDEAKVKLEAAGVDLILVRDNAGGPERDSNGLLLDLPVVTDGRQEIADTYSLFRRSFADDPPASSSPLGRHMELLIDKQGYIRARWLPAEGDAWRQLDNLMSQIELLRNEKPRAPAPDEHVH